MKEFIMKEKLTKKGVGFLCVLGMISPIKFETICVFLVVIEKFSQLNYLKKSMKKQISQTSIFCNYGISIGSSPNKYFYVQIWKYVSLWF